MLYLSTCVGFGYGLCPGYFLGLIHCKLNPIRTYNLLNPSLPGRFRNINLIAIDYASLPRLRDRLTLRRLAFSFTQETLDFQRKSLSLFFSLLMSAFSLLIPPAYLTVHLLRLTERSATTYTLRCKSATSVYGFSPVTSSAQDVLFRSVSYYAFFKGWLLLSQPPDCFGHLTSFTT